MEKPDGYRTGNRGRRRKSDGICTASKAGIVFDLGEPENVMTFSEEKRRNRRNGRKNMLHMWAPIPMRTVSEFIFMMWTSFGELLTERKVVPINNPSDLIVSHSGKYLYSIADEGVEAFAIQPDGDLIPINKKWIGGMRGCYVELDDEDRYLFVGGYHDGRVSMMRLSEDGGVAEIADGIFHKGLGRGVAERSFQTPCTLCKKVTPDRNFFCAVDSGLDHVKIYRINYERGRIKLADILRCELDSGPRMIRFSVDGRFAYVLCELKNTVDVYKYYVEDDQPVFERVQSISTDYEDEGLPAMHQELNIPPMENTSLSPMWALTM